jgi:hypothetical protein
VRDVAFLRPESNRRSQGCCASLDTEFPIAKEPTTLGQHLKKKRFSAVVRQREAAVKLGVCARTLGLWECDRIYLSWAFQPLLIAYLEYDPFTEIGLENTKCNETQGVAFLCPDAPCFNRSED